MSVLKTIGTVALWVLIVLGITCGALNAAGYHVSRGDTVGTDALEQRYQLLEQRFGEQQELIASIQSETGKALGTIDSAIVTGGRAAERVQAIAEKLETLIDCLRSIDNNINEYNDRITNKLNPVGGADGFN